jgi:hypothetical protein
MNGPPPLRIDGGVAFGVERVGVLSGARSGTGEPTYE